MFHDKHLYTSEYILCKKKKKKNGEWMNNEKNDDEYESKSKYIEEVLMAV